MPRTLSSGNTPRRISFLLGFVPFPLRIYRAVGTPGITNQARTRLSLVRSPLFLLPFPPAHPPTSLSLAFYSRVAPRNADGPLATPTFVSYSSASERNEPIVRETTCARALAGKIHRAERSSRDIAITLTAANDEFATGQNFELGR